jgi:hypothetical protein
MTRLEIRTEWLKRLRSGEIKQARASLGKVTGERCCLGVLCDMAVEEKIIPPPKVCSHSKDELSYKGEEGILPTVVKDWIGLFTADGMFDGDDSIDKVHCLTDLNDDGMPFDKIADVIEEKANEIFND